MSKKRDKEIAEVVRNLHSLGDPKWRKTAIEHIKEMLQDPESAERVAKVVKAFSSRAKPKGP